MPCELFTALTIVAQAMVHVPASDMAPQQPSSAMSTTAEAAQPAIHRGHVVSAPHDGFDLGSGLVAQRVASELRWGLVVAQEYRQTSARRWFDVNRPTERRWISGSGFADQRSRTARASDVYEQYQRRVRLAAEVSQSPVDFLLEVHAHERRVVVGGVRVPLMAIEMATNGFTLAELREIKARYNALVSNLPAGARVPLAIDDLDRRYVYRGGTISFYFRASGARSEGSLRSSQARRALHLELPPIVVAVPELRAVYARIIASLVRPYSSGSGGGLAGGVSGN